MINLGSKAGTRPVVVLTRQNVIEYLNKVIVVEITTCTDHFALHRVFIVPLDFA